MGCLFSDHLPIAGSFSKLIKLGLPPKGVWVCLVVSFVEDYV